MLCSISTRPRMRAPCVYLISDFMDIGTNLQHDVSLIQLRRKCDVVFIAINDAADKSIYPVGNLGFVLTGREKIVINTESVAGREAYADQWKENRASLYEMTNKLKIPMIELTTESDIRQDLIFSLKNIRAYRQTAPIKSTTYPRGECKNESNRTAIHDIEGLDSIS